MDKNTHYKRRNYFINKEFQGKYIFNCFLIIAIGSILFIGIFSFFSSNTLSIAYDNYHLQLGLTPGILFKKLLYTQWFFIALGGGLVIVITLFLSHRVAGPFFRFEKALDEMIQGRIANKIVLRKKDEGKKLAQKINTFNLKLSHDLSLMENFNSSIVDSSRQMEKALKSPEADIEALASLLNQIRASHKNIQTLVDSYTFLSEKKV